MILTTVAGVCAAAFAWYLWVNVRGLARLRRREAPVVISRRTYAPLLPDKPLDTSARALMRELHSTSREA